MSGQNLTFLIRKFIHATLPARGGHATRFARSGNNFYDVYIKFTNLRQGYGGYF